MEFKDLSCWELIFGARRVIKLEDGSYQLKLIIEEFEGLTFFKVAQAKIRTFVYSLETGWIENIENKEYQPVDLETSSWLYSTLSNELRERAIAKMNASLRG